jgi:hypothetical protein
MPLLYSDFKPSNLPDRVIFQMAEPYGRTHVLCEVSHRALGDLARKKGHVREAKALEIFRAYRELIEQVASEAFGCLTAAS